MSALPLKVDIDRSRQEVRLVPKTNIASLNWQSCLGDYSFKDAKSCNAIPAKRFSTPTIRQSGERRVQSVGWNGIFTALFLGTLQVT